jgi:hypothetical protein
MLRKVTKKSEQARVGTDASSGQPSEARLAGAWRLRSMKGIVSVWSTGGTVSTSKSLAIRVGGVTVSPAPSVWTEFEVRDVDGTIRTAARKGDLTLSDDKGSTTLAQGQETTCEESPRDKNRKKR